MKDNLLRVMFYLASTEFRGHLVEYNQRIVVKVVLRSFTEVRLKSTAMKKSAPALVKDLHSEMFTGKSAKAQPRKHT